MACNLVLRLRRAAQATTPRVTAMMTKLLTSNPPARIHIPASASSLSTKATTMRLTKANGTRNFQAKFNMWSMRKRGQLPRAQMNTKTMAKVLIKNQSHVGRIGQFHPLSNHSQPFLSNFLG